MNTLREPYTTFMTSTRHIDASEQALHFRPNLSTDSTEIDYYHENPDGTKILNYQRRGAAVMNEVTKLLYLDGDPVNIQYLDDIFWPAAYNSNAYTTHGTRQAMNRQVAMPYMINPRTGEPLNFDDAKVHTLGAMDLSEAAAQNLLHRHIMGKEPQYKTVESARHIANSAFWLTATAMSLDYGPHTAFKTQEELRARLLERVERSRHIGSVIHMIPSLGAAGDIDSTYSAYARRNAPTKKARSAIVQAQEAYALAA